MRKRRKRRTVTLAELAAVQDCHRAEIDRLTLTLNNFRLDWSQMTQQSARDQRMTQEERDRRKRDAQEFGATLAKYQHALARVRELLAKLRSPAAKLALELLRHPLAPPPSAPEEEP